jgi:glutaredoxin-related protein
MIVTKEQSIKDARTQTTSKVDKLCSSKGMLDVLKKGGLDVKITADATDEPMYKQFGIYDVHGVDYIFNVATEFGNLQRVYSQYGYSRTTDDLVDLTYKVKSTDFERLSIYYDILDVVDGIRNSKPIQQLLELFNEFDSYKTQTQIEIDALRNQIESINEMESERLLNRILSGNGYEYEYYDQTDCNSVQIQLDEVDEDGDNLTDWIYVTETSKRQGWIDFKDQDGDKWGSSICKIYVGDKVKGSQRYVCDLYKWNDGIELYKEDVEVTKKQITDWVNRAFEYNTDGSIQTNNEYQLERFERCQKELHKPGNEQSLKKYNDYIQRQNKD